MKVLCTFPGKFGDLIWALPTLRAISRRIGEPVDLLTTKDMASILALLTLQPYIGRAMYAEEWVDADVYPLERRMPPDDGGFFHYDQVFHLGYPDWPQRGLPYYTLDTFNGHKQDFLDPLVDSELHLEEPWITLPQASKYGTYRWAWVHGFSDDHFELKAGLLCLLSQRGAVRQGLPGRLPPTKIGSSPRWETELGESPTSWEDSVAILQRADACLCCNSGLHVLAVAVGCPVVMMEPSEARWNKIFYPLGDTGPQVTLVRGTDGLPTFDARHVADALQSVLTAQKAPR